MRQILCYGDSNTWGLIPDTKDRYPWGVRWTSLLQEKLKDKKVRVIEEGLCGRTTIFEDVYRENRNGLKTLPLEDMSISCRYHCICPPGTKRHCTDRRDIPGSTAFVPSVAGLIIAAEVIKDLSLR